nr:hypothetical protein [uncultured bacterium]
MLKAIRPIIKPFLLPFLASFKRSMHAPEQVQQLVLKKSSTIWRQLNMDRL